MNSDIENFDSGLDVEGYITNCKIDPASSECRDFIKELEKSRLIVALRGEERRMVIAKTKNNDNLIPVFPNYEEFENWPNKSDIPYIIDYAELKKRALDKNDPCDGIAINHKGSTIFIVIKRSNSDIVSNPNNMTQYKGGTLEREKGQLALFKPHKVPEEFRNVLRDYLESKDNVYRAYILLSQRPDSLSPRLTLLLDFDGDQKSFFSELMETVTRSIKLNPGEKIDLIKGDYKLLAAANKIVEPFYKR
ncbi:MAG: enhanced serine sensitivity protein SseB C-terminal domain-containing protein [Oscillospiraceae bacterium]|nr:enhanced serine sensitivity protein SseB C-terminal domain-containing protein [Oscillospiraceae bacterium]